MTDKMFDTPGLEAATSAEAAHAEEVNADIIQQAKQLKGTEIKDKEGLKNAAEKLKAKFGGL